MDDILMQTAFTISQRGTCSRRQVGALVADERGTIFSWGYNGAVSGVEHCKPHNDYQPCEVSEHAERNVLYWCARKGVSTEGLIMYSTDAPCHGCARAIVQCGISRLIYSREYRHLAGLNLLAEAGIKVNRHA